MISHPDDILLAELTAIYHGLRMAIDMSIDDSACYSDSLLSISLIKGDTPHYHIYDVLIQDIKDMLASNNFSVHHTLIEGNQSADFMVKLGSASDVGFIIHSASPEDLLHLIQNIALGVSFSRT